MFVANENWSFESQRVSETRHIFFGNVGVPGGELMLRVIDRVLRRVFRLNSLILSDDLI